MKKYKINFDTDIILHKKIKSKNIFKKPHKASILSCVFIMLNIDLCRVMRYNISEDKGGNNK